MSCDIDLSPSIKTGNIHGFLFLSSFTKSHSQTKASFLWVWEILQRGLKSYLALLYILYIYSYIYKQNKYDLELTICTGNNRSFMCFVLRDTDSISHKREITVTLDMYQYVTGSLHVIVVHVDIIHIFTYLCTLHNLGRFYIDKMSWLHSNWTIYPTNKLFN